MVNLLFGLVAALLLGFSVPQKHSFFGLPWMAGMATAPNAPRVRMTYIIQPRVARP